MSSKQLVDKAAIEALVEQIDSAERKLRMMKQYISPEKGVISNISNVAGLFQSSNECMKTINDLLVKFM